MWMDKVLHGVKGPWIILKGSKGKNEAVCVYVSLYGVVREGLSDKMIFWLTCSSSSDLQSLRKQSVRDKFLSSVF